MHKTTILLPESLWQKAKYKALSFGISLGEFIRQSLERSLKEDGDNLLNDPFVLDDNFYTGDAPADSSVNHDKYIYGAKL